MLCERGAPTGARDARRFDAQATFRRKPLCSATPARLLPRWQLRCVETADLEHRGARATGLDREGDRERLRLLRLAPQRLLVLDEHRDRLVGLRSRGGHQLRRRVVELHLDLAAAVAIE